MDFKKRKIRKETKPLQNTPQVPEIKQTVEPGPKTYRKKISLPQITVWGSVAFLLVLIIGIYVLLTSIDFTAIVFSFGKNLDTDTKGYTNFLLVGVGGEGHDGAYLTDTIMVASIDYKNKTVSMLSIPRDFYIYSKELGNQKINSVYYSGKVKYGEKQAMYTLKSIVSDITGLDIQYYGLIDFKGFKKIIDSMGGVDVMVEKAIYDPMYPKGETIYYETFKLDAGLQHLDGDIALKYARSRETTSDFDRAKRQQILLQAIKEKALSLNILTDANKLQGLYESVADSVQTNLSLSEIIELAKISKGFSKENIFPLVLNNDPAECGGLIYTPVREYFGGASVQLPVGKDYEYIHDFINTSFRNTKILAQEGNRIQVLNGTKTPGLAWDVLEILSRFCMNVVYYGNARDTSLETSTIYYTADENGNPPEILELIKQAIPVSSIKEGIPAEYLESERRQNTNVVVELGKDYLDAKVKDPFDSLKYMTPVAPEKTDSTTTNSTATDSTAAVSTPKSTDSETPTTTTSITTP